MIRIIASLLLAGTGAGAVYGGMLLVADPTGWKLGLNTSLLQHSPFDDFLMPGLILLVILGFGSLLVLALSLMKTKHSATWIILSGFVLSGWISVQILMIREVNGLQILFAFAGILLVVLGIIERRKEFNA
jgi:hypothetical protein